MRFANMAEARVVGGGGGGTPIYMLEAARSEIVTREVEMAVTDRVALFYE